MVAPLAGAWIEIAEAMKKADPKMSLPSRERGLKFKATNMTAVLSVAPLAGAWIEIIAWNKLGGIFDVAPLAGAWIEI